MDDRDDAPDLLRMAILAILASHGPMSAEEIVEELARLALEGQWLALSSERERTGR